MTNSSKARGARLASPAQRRRCKRSVASWVTGAAALALCSLQADLTFASENGTTNWPLGVQTVYPAILPPPGGTEFYNYTLSYTAGDFNNSRGSSAVPGFNLAVQADAARVVHTWQTTPAGLNLSTGVIAAVDHINLSAAGGHGDATGLDYVFLTPLYVTYTTGPYHFLAGPGVFIPTASFDSKRLANATNNYTTFTQELALTYTPSARLDASVETTISVNGANDVTHYQSGDNVDSDFSVDYAPFKSLPKLKLGINGFYAEQFTDDAQNGRRVGDGNRLREVAVGPQFIWSFNPAFAVVLKWQHEVVASNVPAGDRVWVEFAHPL